MAAFAKPVIQVVRRDKCGGGWVVRVVKFGGTGVIVWQHGADTVVSVQKWLAVAVGWREKTINEMKE